MSKKDRPYWLERLGYSSIAEMVDDCFRREVIARLEYPLIRAIVRRHMNWPRDFEINPESIRAVRYEQRTQICDSLYKNLQRHSFYLRDRHWRGNYRGWELRRERLGKVQIRLSKFCYRVSDVDQWLGGVA